MAESRWEGNRLIIKPDPMIARVGADIGKVILGSIVIKGLKMIATVRLDHGGKSMSQTDGDHPVRRLDIPDAKKIAEQLGIEGVIIIGFEKLPDGEFKGVSYGADRLRSQTMGLLLDKIGHIIRTSGGGNL